MNAMTKTENTLIKKEESIKLDNLVHSFNISYQKTAEDMLEMAKVAYEAKGMGKGLYALFCERVYMKSESTMSKLVSIGKNYLIFSEHKDKLPSQWTTLYSLSLLKPEVFIEKCTSGVINPNLTGNEVLTLMGKEVQKKVKPTKPTQESNSTEEHPGIGAFIYCSSPELTALLTDVIKYAAEKGLSVQANNNYQLYQDNLIEEVV